MTLKEACLQCQGFDKLASILKDEMKEQAFRTTNYDLLKMKYDYLTELVNLIHNETFEENKK